MSISLPTWNLNDLYPHRESPELQADLATAEKACEAFVSAYQDKLIKADPLAAKLLAAIQDYEKIQEILGRLMSFGYLLYSTHLEDPEVLKFFQGLQEKATVISSPLVFFTLDLNDISDEALTKAYATSPDLKRYKPWIDSLRLFKPYLLSNELERFIHDKSVTGRNAWVRLYDETMAQTRCPFGDQRLPISNILNYMGDEDADVRKEAAKGLSVGLTERLHLLTLITNMLAKDKEIEDTWRKYPHSVSSRNLTNQIEDEVVDTLVAAVKESYPILTHRYYAWKARFCGKAQLEYWDRNAPLPDANRFEMPWESAKTLVLDAYNNFSPPMAQIARRFFDESWIDAASNSGKQSGAFSHPTVPSVHPYILMSYHGKARDVMTLAHELGHGIHQILAGPQGMLLADTPLTIAETASVFGEMLTFQALLRQTGDVQERRSLLASKIEDMLNTVVRQVAFFDFERQVHDQRRQGELTSEELGELWIQTQELALGPAVRVDPLVRPYWGYISHFIHAPFYVYAYAFGDCLVNSLYAVYANGFENFEQKYLDLLRAGGSLKYNELLAPFGLDAHDPTFWTKGLSLISKMIDSLESL